MEEVKSSRYVSIAIRIILFLVIVNLLWWIRPIVVDIWDVVKEVTVPFIGGLVIAYLLHPVVVALERRKVPRLVAVLLIYVSFVLVCTIAVVNAIPVFTKQLFELADDIPRLTNWYHQWMSEWEANKYFLPDSIQSGVDRVIIQSQERMSLTISQLVNNAKSTIGKFLGYAIIPFIAFYLLKDLKDIQKGMLLLIPKHYRRQATQILREIDDSLGKYIHGQMVVALIVGTLAYIGYWLIDMPYPFVLASFVSITNVIPYIGPLIGATPALIVALTISTKTVLLILLVNLVVQMVEGNILSPNIVGKSLHMHPLAIIFALLVGETVGGILGMIVAVPLFAIGKVILVRITLMARES
ncbi:AI-2E family transporter [Brevibacillus sp. SYSU BS000544]|uniref:AI-2E family transporter n=1 Tax=Brevibacillus sp. SYSU BS000544 TaxID=3416443 RepID=UPI003CE5183A